MRVHKISNRIAYHFVGGEVAVISGMYGGPYDLYADDTLADYLGNVSSIEEAKRFLTDF